MTCVLVCESSDLYADCPESPYIGQEQRKWHCGLIRVFHDVIYVLWLVDGLKVVRNDVPMVFKTIFHYYLLGFLVMRGAADVVHLVRTSHRAPVG